MGAPACIVWCSTHAGSNRDYCVAIEMAGVALEVYGVYSTQRVISINLVVMV